MPEELLMKGPMMNKDLFLYGVVNQSASKKILKGIIAGNADPAVDTIRLFINSEGGWLYDGFAIVSAIRSSTKPVYTYAMGVAASCGLLILSSGWKRYASVYSRGMQHSVNCSMPREPIQSIIENVDVLKEENRQFEEMFMDFTKFPKALIEKNKKAKIDMYLTALEMKKYGIVDEILGAQSL